MSAYSSAVPSCIRVNRALVNSATGDPSARPGTCEKCYAGPPPAVDRRPAGPSSGGIGAWCPGSGVSAGRTGVVSCSRCRLREDAMTNPAGIKPLRSDAVRTRKLLVKAASEAFAEHGSEVSVAQIAERAGIGKGTVFRHFATKAGRPRGSPPSPRRAQRPADAGRGHRRTDRPRPPGRGHPPGHHRARRHAADERDLPDGIPCAGNATGSWRRYLQLVFDGVQAWQRTDAAWPPTAGRGRRRSCARSPLTVLAGFYGTATANRADALPCPRRVDPVSADAEHDYQVRLCATVNVTKRSGCVLRRRLHQ